MRRTVIAVALSLAAASPAVAGPPWIRASLPADYDAARAHGAFMLIHTFHHADPMPLASLAGTAEGLVDGQRRSVPLTFQPDTAAQGGNYFIAKSWPDGGVWVLNIEGRLDMGAGLVIGIGRDGVPVLVQTPRGRYGVSRPATAREVNALLEYLNGDRATMPTMADPAWRNLFTPPGMLLMALAAGVGGILWFLVRAFQRRTDLRVLKHSLG